MPRDQAAFEQAQPPKKTPKKHSDGGCAYQLGILSHTGAGVATSRTGELDSDHEPLGEEPPGVPRFHIDIVRPGLHCGWSGGSAAIGNWVAVHTEVYTGVCGCELARW